VTFPLGPVSSRGCLGAPTVLPTAGPSRHPPLEAELNSPPPPSPPKKKVVKRKKEKETCRDFILFLPILSTLILLNCKRRICFRIFCVLQMSGLKPIGSNMLKLILEYSKLAAALDTTRHHMSVNGVFPPDNHGMNSD